MERETLCHPTYENLNEEGYLIVDNVLEPEELKLVKEAILEDALDLVFSQQGFEVDWADPDSTRLFFDQKLRTEKLGSKAKRCVWRGGNTLYPLINKTTGMIHIHFNPVVMENIIFNPKLYEISKEVNGTPHLAYITGPERVSIKSKGSSIMPQHIDSNPFHPEVNYPFRIQSFVVLDINTDPKYKLQHSGTLAILPYFHHYWNFAGRLFHPTKGFSDCKFPEDKSRFFRLPKGRKSFDKYYLPELKKYASWYADFLEGRSEKPEGFGLGWEKVRSLFQKISEEGITVPSNSKGYLKKMVWKPLPLEPGSMVFWHQHLPHRSLANKSDTPRVVAYYNLFPVDKDWWGTEEQKWVARQFKRCEFYYGTDWGNYPTNIVNIEEHLRLVEQGRVEEVASLSTSSPFRRKISGQEDYFT